MLYKGGNPAPAPASYLPTMPRVLRTSLVCLLLTTLGFGGGCREFANHRMQLGSLHASGNYDQAAATLDDPKSHDLYGKKNELLWHLDRGAIALARDDQDKAIELLEKAEAAIEVQREKSALDVLGQWTINDTTSAYVAEPYEDMYVNVLKLLAQLEAGRVEGGASVEARRAAFKADTLRDQYTQYAKEIEKKGKNELSRAGQGRRLSSGGKFVESPLATYLTILTFLKTGDTELARVAARRLQSSLELQGELVGNVRAEDFADLETLESDEVNTLVVAFSGRGPTKYAERIGPIPLGTLPLYMELPQLQIHPSQIGGARIEVEGSGGQAEALADCKLVEDLSRVAYANHQEMMPLIQARTFMRYALKAGTSMVLTEMGRRGAHDRDQGLVQLAGVVAGLAVLAATEEADLRCWTFLPGQARVGALKLPAGPHRVRVVYLSHAGGTLYTTAWKQIDVSPAGLATIVTHYPR
jgi:hypothetical protein